MSRGVFITGGTGFIGRRLVSKLLESGDRVFILTRKNSEGKVNQILKKLPKNKRKNLKIVSGDITSKDVIDNPHDLEEVRNETTEVYHLAAVYDLAVDKKTATLVNINGTENILNLSKSMKNIRSLNHVSTIAISGDFSGIFYEYNFDDGQKFSNWYAWSKFESEKLIRQNWGRLPTRIFRPGAVIGDSRTGEMDKLDGPYYAILLLTLGIHFITPGAGDSTIPIAPVDFVVNAINQISRKDDSVNKAFFLVDPKPPTYSEFIDVVCEKLETFKPIKKFNLKPIAPILDIPMRSRTIKALSRMIEIPVEGLSYAYLDVHYDTSNTRRFLAGSNISCPRFSEYASKIVSYFVNTMLKQKPVSYFIWKRGKALRNILRKLLNEEAGFS